MRGTALKSFRPVTILHGRRGHGRRPSGYAQASADHRDEADPRSRGRREEESGKLQISA